MNKFIRNGKVAIVISPGYGSGWSTFCPEGQAMDRLFDPNLVELLEREGLSYSKRAKLVMKYTKDTYGESAETSDLMVVWLPVGTWFRVGEYDGSESIELYSETKWVEA